MAPTSHPSLAHIQTHLQLTIGEPSECNTSRTPVTARATPAAIGDWREHPIATKKCEREECKPDYDWSESEG